MGCGIGQVKVGLGEGRGIMVHRFTSDDPQHDYHCMIELKLHERDLKTLPFIQKSELRFAFFKRTTIIKIHIFLTGKYLIILVGRVGSMLMGCDGLIFNP